MSEDAIHDAAKMLAKISVNSCEKYAAMGQLRSLRCVL